MYAYTVTDHYDYSPIRWTYFVNTKMSKGGRQSCDYGIVKNYLRAYLKKKSDSCSAYSVHIISSNAQNDWMISLKFLTDVFLHCSTVLND